MFTSPGSLPVSAASALPLLYRTPLEMCPMPQLPPRDTRVGSPSIDFCQENGNGDSFDFMDETFDAFGLFSRLIPPRYRSDSNSRAVAEPLGLQVQPL